MFPAAMPLDDRHRSQPEEMQLSRLLAATDFSAVSRYALQYAAACAVTPVTAPTTPPGLRFRQIFVGVCSEQSCELFSDGYLVASSRIETP